MAEQFWSDKTCMLVSAHIPSYLEFEKKLTIMIEILNLCVRDYFQHCLNIHWQPKFKAYRKLTSRNILAAILQMPSVPLNMH